MILIYNKIDIYFIFLIIIKKRKWNLLMPKNYSARELRNILEATNKKFSSLIKKVLKYQKNISQLLKHINA